MKKKLLTLVLSIFAFMLLLASCDNKNAEQAHTHEWSNTYSHDATYHWKTCSGCNEISEKSAHKYGDWVEVTAATEETKGLKKHVCEVCGYEATEEIEKLAHTHNYGSMYYAVPATFFNDGNIAYYHCEGCDKYFDENKNEVSTVVIPKLSTDIVLLVNGTKVGDFVTTAHENSIEWDLTNIELDKDDVISVAAKADNTKTYDYFADTSSNITKENKVHNDADSATVHIVGTPNGLQLSISGFEYDGITVKVTRGTEVVEYPMTAITYNYGSEITSYIYGYLSLLEGDKVVIVDHDNDVIYDYDDVAEQDLWQTLTFEKNTNNEIVILRDVRLGFEFVEDEILIDAVYQPGSSNSYSVELKGEAEKAPMTKATYNKNSDIYKNATYSTMHESTINNADFKTYLEANGLIVYSFSATFPENSEIRIFNGTSAVDYKHLSDVYVIDTKTYTYDYSIEAINSVFAYSDGYIKLKMAGSYKIDYYEAYDMFTITYPKVEAQASSYKYTPGDGTYVDLEADSSGIITMSNFEAEQYDTITFTTADKIIIKVTLDSSVSATTAYCTNGVIMFFKGGKYDIVFNTNTNVVNIVDKTPASLIGGSIMATGTYTTKTFVVNPSNDKEACITGYVVSDVSKYHAIRDSKDAEVNDLTVASDSVDYVITFSGSYLIMFKEVGTYSIYINVETHEIRVVKTA